MKYFEIKVTNCTECKHRFGAYCCHDPICLRKSPEQRGIIFDENCQELTPSCPMWQETKEQV